MKPHLDIMVDLAQTLVSVLFAGEKILEVELLCVPLKSSKLLGVTKEGFLEALLST